MTLEYQALCNRLAELEKHLLPTINPIGNYTDAEYDRTRAYIALVHAEMESFIESRCKYAVTVAERNWFKNREVNIVIFTLYAMCYSGWSELDADLPPLPKLDKKYEVDARITSSLKQYKHVLDTNHGIKETYLNKMLVPLSIRIADLDTLWVTQMSTFGGIRGQIAHTSGKTNQPPDPATTVTLINTVLLPGLDDLDTRISGIVTTSSFKLGHQGFFKRIEAAFKLLLNG